MAHAHYSTKNLDTLHWVILYDLLLNVNPALLLRKVCPRLPILYILLYIQLCLFLSLHKMKILSLLVALQATRLTKSLPLLQAQAPNDILAASVQSLPLSSETPDTTGVVYSN